MAEPPPRIYSDSLGTEIYDVLGIAIRGGGPTQGDIEFFAQLAAEVGGPVLEIGCGTGRVAGALAAAGFDVVGVDRSAPMLRLAEERRGAAPPEVAARLTYVHADMATLRLAREFPLIVAPSRVFQFALTSGDQRAALKAFRSHLARDGRLVLDLFDPSLEYLGPGAIFPPRGGELVHPKTGNRVEWEIVGREPDPSRQLVISDWVAREIGPSGDVIRDQTERLTLRWSTRSEMRLLFELEGLSVVADYGDFHGGPPAYGTEQVWVLRKSDPGPT